MDAVGSSELSDVLSRTCKTAMRFSSSPSRLLVSPRVSSEYIKAFKKLTLEHPHLAAAFGVAAKFLLWNPHCFCQTPQHAQKPWRMQNRDGNTETERQQYCCPDPLQSKRFFMGCHMILLIRHPVRHTYIGTSYRYQTMDGYSLERTPRGLINDALRIRDHAAFHQSPTNIDIERYFTSRW